MKSNRKSGPRDEVAGAIQTINDLRSLAWGRILDPSSRRNVEWLVNRYRVYVALACRPSLGEAFRELRSTLQSDGSRATPPARKGPARRAAGPAGWPGPSPFPKNPR